MPHNTMSDAGSDSAFEQIDILRNAEGLIVVITKKRSNGALSCAMFKEFERNGETERSSFFQRRQIDQAIELLRLAAERMDQEVDKERAAERLATDTRQRDRRRVNGKRH